MKGMKFDEQKNRLDLIYPEFIEALGKVLTKGAIKYEPNNWQKVEDAKDRYYAALLRHLMAYRRGERFDKQSGFTHLAHAICNLFIIYWHEEVKNKKKRVLKK